MKKLFPLLFLLVIAFNSLFGQSTIGVKAGLNISNVSNPYDDFSSLSSYHAGVIFRLKMSRKFSLNTEALLSNKGFKSVLIPSGTTTNHLSYVSVPVLAHYNLTNKIYLQAGPEFCFLTNAKLKNSTLHESVDGDYNNFDFSLAGGIGIALFRIFNLESRYSLGLSQIRKNEDIFGSYKNRTLQISLLYLFKNKE